MSSKEASGAKHGVRFGIYGSNMADIYFNECGTCEYKDCDCLVCCVNKLRLALNNMIRSFPILRPHIPRIECNWYMEKHTGYKINKTHTQQEVIAACNVLCDICKTENCEECKVVQLAIEFQTENKNG